MAVQYVQGGGGLLGTLGTLATIAGGFAGAPTWLTPLGMGMSTISDLMAGARLAGYAADNILGKWLNPAAGTISNAEGVVTKSDPQITDEWRKSMILQNQDPYGRRNAWQQ